MLHILEIDIHLCCEHKVHPGDLSLNAKEDIFELTVRNKKCLFALCGDGFCLWLRDATHKICKLFSALILGGIVTRLVDVSSLRRDKT